MFHFKTLRARLFAVFAGFSVILISVFLVFNVYSFYQGLLKYVKEKELSAVEKVAELMTSRVTSKTIVLQRIQSRQWRDTVRDGLLSVADQSEREEVLRAERFSPRPPPARRTPSLPLGEKYRPPPLPLNINNRIALVDLDRVPVFGRIRQDKDTLYLPIYNGDRKTAYIAYAPRASQFAKHEQTFIRQQIIGFLLISILAIMVCAVIAWWLANRISHPLMLVADSARRLSSGEYGINVELSKSENKLKDEIGRLVKDFNYLSRVLEKNETSRLNWSSDIAHELRTPVAVLKGEIEAVIDGIRPLTLDSVESLKEEVLLLEKMIADLRLLTLSDAGALDYHMEELDLNVIIRQSVTAINPLFLKAGLTLKYQMRTQPKRIYGDQARLKQLINNLLTNSLKYTDAPSDVAIALDSVDGHAQITLEDGAPGVPSESLPLLFERLYRVDKSRSRSSGGSGLGMAICKNIAEAHGASITCDHSTLGGLKVTILFKD